MEPLRQTARSVPTRVVDYYTWPIMLWATGLLFLFGAQLADLHLPSGRPVRMELGLGLCYPLAAWNTGITLWWARHTRAALAAGHLTSEEGRAGARYISQLLAQAAASPAIIFLAGDPLKAASWATCISIALTAGAAYAAIEALVRVPGEWAKGAALTVGLLALPLNATGAVSFAWWMGLFDPVLSPVVQVLGQP